MSDEEVQSEEPEGVDVDTQEKAEGQTNDEAMKNRFKLIEGEEVLLTKSPSPVGFMNMYVLGLIVFGVHMLFWKPDALLNENSGGFAKFMSGSWDWVVQTSIRFCTGYGNPDMVQQNDEYINLWQVGDGMVASCNTLASFDSNRWSHCFDS